MLITHKFDMAVDRRGPAPLVDAVQGDTNTREIRVSLFITPSPNKKEAWPIPDGTSAFIRFRKPDGSGGVYDAMPDGTSAISYSGNTVQALIAPQMLTVPGQVLAQIELNNGDSVLGTFMFKVLVEPDPSVGAMTSEDYVNLTGYVAKEIERILGAGNLPGGAEEVVISSKEPTDENAKIWINPDGEDLGGSVMVVTVTKNEDNNYYTPNHTHAEVLEWLDNGGSAVLVDGRTTYLHYRSVSSYSQFRREITASGKKVITVFTMRDNYLEYGNVAYVQGEEKPLVDVATAEVGQTIMVEKVDSNGKPTKWKAVDYQPRTHYKDVVELFNATLTGLSEAEVPLEGFSMQAGETYYVTWNGVEYTCVCVEVPNTNGMRYIGNSSPFGGEDSGEPFVIVYGTEDGVTFFTMAMGMDGIDEVAVVIKGTGYIPIPVPYLTNALPYYINAVITGTTNGVDQYATSITTAEVDALIASGREIKMRMAASAVPELIFTLSMFTHVRGENGYVLGFSCSNLFASAANIVKFLIPQADGTYIVRDSLGD